MKNITILLGVSAACTLMVACGSSSSGNGAGSGNSTGSGSGSSESGSTSTSGSTSGAGTSSGNPILIDSGSPMFNLDAAIACMSAAQCPQTGQICCLNGTTGSGMLTVCQAAGMTCPSTLVGTYQLCASAAECTTPGMTECAEPMVAGFTIPGIGMVCQAPAAATDSGSTGAADTGTTTVTSDAGTQDAPAGG
jgi:hypothetical protein